MHLLPAPRLSTRIISHVGPIGRTALKYFRALPKKTRKLISLLLIFAIVTPFYLFGPFSKKAQAAWFDENWAYRQAVTVTVTSNASDIASLDTLITVNTSALISASTLQSACQDLRFTNTNGKALPYYIDSGCNTTTTKIWVRVDLVPKNTTTYTTYMYYGNPSAAAGSDSTKFNLYNGLVGYWTMNESSWTVDCSTGSVKDSSVNANNGKSCPNSTGPTGGATGNYANAGSFDGSNDYVEIADNASLRTTTTLTVSTWANIPSGTADFHYIVDKWTYGVGNFRSWSLNLDSDGTTLIWRGSTAGTDATVKQVSTSYSPYFSKWTLITGVYDGTNLILYINGSRIGSTALSSIISTSKSVFIGAGDDGTQKRLNGSVDDTRVYNRALSAPEATQLYTNPGSITTTATTTSAPSTAFGAEEKGPSPVLYWKFDEGTGTTTVDSTTNRNTANLGGTFSAPALGSGTDGAVTFSSDTNINTVNTISGRSCADGGDAVNYSVTTLTSTTATLSTTPSAGCLAAGNEILLINLQGTTSNFGNAGNYESLTIQSISTNVITFTAAKTKFYGNGTGSDDTNIGTATTNQRVMLQRVPNYTNVTVNSGKTLTANAWNGTKNGILFFRASGTVTVTGTISMNGNGYRGPTGTANQGGQGGEAFCGLGGAAGGGNGAAGGGSPYQDQTSGGNGTCGGGGGGYSFAGIGSASQGGAGGAGGGQTSSGGGGGYGTFGFGGNNGGTNSSGDGIAGFAAPGGGGGTYGTANLTTLFPGSSGGAGGWAFGTAGTGGSGGGIIGIIASTVTVTGGITSNGTNGTNNIDNNANGGGGAGGSILIQGSTINLGANLVTAAAGPSTTYSGGSGRIAVAYTTLTGSSNPAVLPTWQTEDQCISGKCLWFDGNTVKVTGSKVAKNIQSVSFWIRPNTIASQGLVNLDGGTHKINTNASGVISAAGFTSPTYYINGNATTTPTLVQNQWNYVSVTTGTGFDSTSSFTVGTDGTNFIKGTIDEVKFYNYARSAAQVQADYAGSTVNGAGEVLGANTQNQPSALSNGLVGYWKMDEASWTNDCSTTSVTDSSGNGNNGKACPSSTGPTGGGAGKFGNAGSFDGSDDYVNVSSFSQTLTSATFTAWINASSFSGCKGLIFSRGTSVTGMNAGACGAATRLGYHWNDNPNTYNWTGGPVIPTNQWVLVVVSVEPTKATAYVGAGGTITSAINAVTHSSTTLDNLNIGQDTLGGRFFAGSVDGVRIYNRALSAGDVSNLYNFAPGPIGYWNFDEGKGSSVNDRSGNANTGTWQGTLGSQWTQGKYGKAGNFNGTNNAVLVTMNNPTTISGSFTVESWFYKKTGSFDTIISPRSGADNLSMEIQVRSKIQYAVTNGTSSLVDTAGSATPANNIWHYVACAVNTTSINCYLDGVLDLSSTWAADTPLLIDPSHTLYIGKDNGHASSEFNGYLDEIKFYNYVRTPKQITQDMNASHPSVGSPVGSAVGYWKLDEGYGNSTASAHNSGSQGSTLNGNITNMASPATATSGWTQSGKFDKALIFDGSNDYVAMPSDVSALKITSDVTLSAWINLTNTSSTHDIICKYTGTASTSAYCLYTDTNGKLNMSVVNATGPAIVTTTGTRTLSASTWYHVVGVFSSASSVTLYIDGRQDKQNTTSIPTTLQNPTTILDIGAENAGSNPMNGTIDEPKVYNYALTASEVALDANRSATVILGATSDNSSYQPNAANQEYCVPGDATSCAAPVGRWDFEEGTGSSVNDRSGNANTGTWNGTLGSQWTGGKIGKAGKFNGSDNYVSVTDNSGLNATTMTTEAWVNPASFSAGGNFPTIYNRRTAGNTGGVTMEVKDGGGQIRCYFYISGWQFADTGTSLTLNAWNHITCSYDGTTIRTYLNGTAGGTTSVSGSINQPASPNVWIGKNISNNSVLQGKIDQVRVFNYARSAAQVAWDYNRGGPVGYWKFDECQGSIAHDASGNANTGTITVGGGGSQTTLGTCLTPTDGTGVWYNGKTGKYNASLNFDGADDFITTSAFSPLAKAGQTTTAVSWGGWFYPTTGVTSKTLMEKASEFRITTDGSSNAVCGIYYSAAFHDASSVTAVLTLSTWNHILCTYDDANIKTYLNGYLVNTTPDTNAITAASSILYLAENSSGAQRYLGQIDEVQIYNYTLNATQVKTVLNQNSAIRFGPTTGSP